MNEKKELYQTRTFIGCIILFVALQLIYVRLIQPNYAYDGYNNDFDMKRCIISWLCFIPAAMIVARTSYNLKTSWVAGSLTLLCGYAPGLILNIYSETEFFGLYVLYYAVFMLAILFIKTVNVKRTFYFKDDKMFNLLGIFMGIVIVYIWVRYTHCHIQLSLLDVYGIRASVASYSYPAIFNYIFSMSKNVIPFMAVYCIYEKKFAKCIYYVLIQYIGFCIDGSKSAVFMLVFAIGMYYILKIVKNYVAWIPWLLVLGVIGAFFENAYINSIYIAGVLYRRVFFVPTLLNYDYYSFFSEHPFDYYRTSISLFGESPYEQSISKIIGEYNGSGSSCNNGMFSDAYSNLGVFGIIVMPILIVLVFKIIEMVAQELPAGVTIAAIISVVLAFISSSFFTNFMSHGVALTILVYYVLPRQEPDYDWEDFRYVGENQIKKEAGIDIDGCV